MFNEKILRKNRSSIIRVDKEFKETLTEIKKELEKKQGINVSERNASKFLAGKIRKGKLIAFWLR